MAVQPRPQAALCTTTPTVLRGEVGSPGTMEVKEGGQEGQRRLASDPTQKDPNSPSVC